MTQLSKTLISKTLTIRSSPHVGAVASVDTIMFNVVLAMLPVCGYAVYAFGLAALLVLTTAIASCVLTEHLLCRISGQASTVGDWSAAITGMLYGLVLPPACRCGWWPSGASWLWVSASSYSADWAITPLIRRWWDALFCKRPFRRR